ncbi:MAG: hypothetical protein PHG81_06010 [Aliarcobacter sp.]|nr:hypothetical protein [Aliarcobacter sp.]
MKKAILQLLIFSFVFVGCTAEKEIVFQDKIVCFEQQKVERVQPTQIRVYRDDIDVAVAYKTAIDSNIEFYEKQVDRTNEFCKGANK